ncbi:MAG TPA: cupin domain-containing protein [Gaiellaceae bacterium]|nr:cupin domain-containing protein [Gaiellaceae bacterium]
MSWFVRNVRDMTWWKRGPGGYVTEFVGDEQDVGVNLFVLEPGDRMAMYHWEADQEGFLVLAGEAILIIDGEERTIRQWDYVHCPPGVPHTRVGAGSEPCVILALGAREHQRGPDWGAYPYSDVAMKYDASAEEETSDSDIAYARFPDREPAEFREEWLH